MEHVFVIVLNWNSSDETLRCIKSLLKLKNEYLHIVVCDNHSSNSEVLKLEEGLQNMRDYSLQIISEEIIKNKTLNNETDILLIKNKKNYGYAGGNNIGIKYALKNEKMDYIWVLNNDTEVDKNALSSAINEMRKDSSIGICGSVLVSIEDKITIQSCGGTINPWLCTTKPISGMQLPEQLQLQNINNKIDYVVGASIFFSKKCLKKIGLLCEDYFLYYEEIDICNRARSADFKIILALDSIVFHEEGVSTQKGKSDIADYCSVKNRILIAKKFYPYYVLTVKLSLIGIIFNRLKRREWSRAYKYLKFFFL